VLGDARLTFVKEARRFDVLVVDVFSSDAIPTHLMTVEAIKGYLEKMTPGGLVVLHVSNRHMTLEPVVAAAGHALGLHAVATRAKDQHWPKEQQDDYKLPADVVALTADPALAAALGARPAWRKVAPSGEKPWTDDFSNVLGAIWKHMRGG
jgi:hypothetical protein